MKILTSLRLVLSFTIPLIITAPAFSWTLDSNKSSISFVTIKNTNIAESHTLSAFSGDIAEGRATLAIKPDSVETRVPIRNDRMREFLFETSAYPIIEVNASVSNVLNELKIGESVLAELPARLSLHGVTGDIAMKVRVSSISESLLTVTTTEPVLIRAADYKMLEGINKLSSLVNNLPIAESVPVSFSLAFIQ